MDKYQHSSEIFAENRNYIPGGVVSVNRATQPEIVFVKGQGAIIWDANKPSRKHHIERAICSKGELYSQQAFSFLRWAQEVPGSNPGAPTNILTGLAGLW